MQQVFGGVRFFSSKKFLGDAGSVMDHIWNSRSVVEKMVKNKIDNSLFWEHVHACGCISDFVVCAHTHLKLQMKLINRLVRGEPFILLGNNAYICECIHSFIMKLLLQKVHKRQVIWKIFMSNMDRTYFVTFTCGCRRGIMNSYLEITISKPHFTFKC